MSIPCPVCGTENEPGANRCDCGSDLRARPGGKPSMGLFYLLLVGVAIILVAWAGSSGREERPPGLTAAEVEEQTAREAERAAKRFIEDKLLAPSQSTITVLRAAKIDNETQRKNYDASYLVSGRVDAPNAFGAQLRKQFACIVNQRSGEWQEGYPCGLH